MTDWLNSVEVREVSGHGDKWLYNRLHDGRIRREYRNVNGRRRVFFHAGDVEREIDTPTVSRLSNKQRITRGRQVARQRVADVGVGDLVTVQRHEGSGAQNEDKPTRGVVVESRERYAVVRFHADDERRWYDECFHYVDMRGEGAVRRAG